MQQIGASRTGGAIALVALLFAASSAARADDQLKVAIGQINNWENQMPTLGQDAGIFKKYGLTLDNFGTAGAGETMQPIISGSADIGIGVGVAGVMRVFSKGAPVRVLLPAFTGTGGLFCAGPPARLASRPPSRGRLRHLSSRRVISRSVLSTSAEVAKLRQSWARTITSAMPLTGASTSTTNRWLSSAS